MPNLSDQMKRKLTLAQETGVSNWLSALPIRAKGFSLNKQEFTDALALRYSWIIKGLPEVCACVENFDECHAMSCQKGGFISIRHDEIRQGWANFSVQGPLSKIHNFTGPHSILTKIIDI